MEVTYIRAYKSVFCNNAKSLENKKTDNFVTKFYLFAQNSTIAKTYTTTAREPSIYYCEIKSFKVKVKIVYI